MKRRLILVVAALGLLGAPAVAKANHWYEASMYTDYSWHTVHPNIEGGRQIQFQNFGAAFFGVPYTVRVIKSGHVYCAWYGYTYGLVYNGNCGVSFPAGSLIQARPPSFWPYVVVKYKAHRSG